jgi:hypothetical protein
MHADKLQSAWPDCTTRSAKGEVNQQSDWLVFFFEKLSIAPTSNSAASRGSEENLAHAPARKTNIARVRFIAAYLPIPRQAKIICRLRSLLPASDIL